jgi:hypothetical protein
MKEAALPQSGRSDQPRWLQAVLTYQSRILRISCSSVDYGCCVSLYDRKGGKLAAGRRCKRRKAVKSLQRSYMGLGRVELPTSRLSGDRGGVRSPARSL